MTAENQATPEAKADKFITTMIDETGCSVKFLNEAKPIIIKMYKDTEGAALESCLASIKETIKNQAEIEKTSARAVRASADRLIGDVVTVH